MSTRCLSGRTGTFVNARSFTTFYSTGSGIRDAMEAICSFEIRHRNSRIHFVIDTGNFLCGVIQVVINSLLFIGRNGVGDNKLTRIVGDGDHAHTKGATPPRKLCLGGMGCWVSIGVCFDGYWFLEIVVTSSRHRTRETREGGTGDHGH